MQKPISSLLVFATLFLLPSLVPAADMDNYQVHRKFENFYSAIVSRRPAGFQQATELTDKLAAALMNKDMLVQATKESIKNDNRPVVYVPGSEWEAKFGGKPVSASDNNQYVTVSAWLQMQSGNLLDLNYAFSFRPAIDAELAQKIATRYAELISPGLQKLSEQQFTEHYNVAFAEAKKTYEAAAEKVSRLETDRRSAQLRSYEELPYEKVADHLADLQRQQLVLKLLLVGMEAKTQEIEKQMKIADMRLKMQAERSAKESVNDESLNEMKKLIALREKSLDNLQDRHKAGLVTQSEVDDAQTRLLETKISLLAHQTKRQTLPNNEQLESLQGELTRLAIDRSEQQARLEYLAEMRHEVQSRIANRANLDRDIQRIDEQLPAASTALRRAETRMKELEDAKAAFKPITLVKTSN